ncbi:MAG: OmpH family outer membrane protein [Nitrospirae bacterium]|nr:OmpH family outer membrane protein [Nitrospirota bacterium]
MSSSPATPQKTTPSISIGVVDTQWLLKESKLGKQVTDTLNVFMKDRQTLIELEQKELRDLQSQLLRQGSVLSPTARQQREDQFRQRMGEYQQKEANMNQEVQGKQGQLFSEFRENVDEVVEALAKQHGLLLVVEKGTNTTTRYFEASLDISPEVLTELNQRNP